MPERPAPTISSSRCSGVGGIEHLERYAGALQPCEKSVTHRDRGGQLAGALRQVVEGEAEAGLGEHLGGLAVSGVAAADPRAHGLAAAFADEGDLEPAALALGFARALSLRFQLQHLAADGRHLGEGSHRGHPGGDAADRRQVLGDHVVAVGEVRPVALERSGRAPDDRAVDRRQRRGPAAERGVAAHARRGGVDLATVGARLGAPPLLGRGKGLPGAPEAVDGGVVGATREGAARPHVAVDGERHALRQLLHREVGAEVVRNRVEAAGVDEARPGPLRFGVVVDPDAVDELRLAGEIDVAGARRGAGRDQRPPVQRIGADRRDHDLRRAGDPVEGAAIGRVGLDEIGRRRPRGGRSETRRDLLQLAAVAADQGPAQLGGTVGGEVVGREPAGESGRPEQGEVILALALHWGDSLRPTRKRHGKTGAVASSHQPRRPSHVHLPLTRARAGMSGQTCERAIFRRWKSGSRSCFSRRS
jgi:hypothetical protein